MMIYELWDMKSVNLVGSYDSEVEALDVVAGAVARYGDSYVAGLALIRENGHGRSRTLAEGSALLERTEKRLQLSSLTG